MGVTPGEPVGGRVRKGALRRRDGEIIARVDVVGVERGEAFARLLRACGGEDGEEDEGLEHYRV
ncbi:MAG: hypothetical protein VYD64_07520, partial [Pseudomonadota bacterium]|nr:hypothetical protein [Pseudomonadota bacterium]